jgi:hypothetical protein
MAFVIVSVLISGALIMYANKRVQPNRANAHRPPLVNASVKPAGHAEIKTSPVTMTSNNLVQVTYYMNPVLPARK